MQGAPSFSLKTRTEDRIEAVAVVMGAWLGPASTGDADDRRSL